MADELTMDIAQSYAQGMVNIFRGFDKINEVLKQAIAADGFLKANKDELAKVQAAITQAKSDYDAAVASYVQKLADAQLAQLDKLAALDKDYLIAKANIDAKINKLSLDAAAQIAALNMKANDALSAKTLAEDSLAKFRDQAQLEKEELTNEISDLEAKLATAKSAMADIKSKLT